MRDLPVCPLLTQPPRRLPTATVCSSYPRSDLLIASHAEDEFVQTSHIYDKQKNLKTASR